VRNTRRQAAIAFNQASSGALERLTSPTGDNITRQVVCGTNSLVVTNIDTHCSILVTYRNGVSSRCSASKIGTNRLATAGHCVFRPDRVSAVLLPAEAD
jgi:V8-like Glu-specific endopeptidase